MSQYTIERYVIQNTIIQYFLQNGMIRYVMQNGMTPYIVQNGIVCYPENGTVRMQNGMMTDEASKSLCSSWSLLFKSSFLRARSSLIGSQSYNTAFQY